MFVSNCVTWPRGHETATSTTRSSWNPISRVPRLSLDCLVNVCTIRPHFKPVAIAHDAYTTSSLLYGWFGWVVPCLIHLVVQQYTIHLPYRSATVILYTNKNICRIITSALYTVRYIYLWCNDLNNVRAARYPNTPLLSYISALRSTSCLHVVNIVVCSKAQNLP